SPTPSTPESSGLPPLTSATTSERSTSPARTGAPDEHTHAPPPYRSHAPWQAAPLHHRGPPRSDQARPHPHPPQARPAHRPRAHAMLLHGPDQRLTTPALAPRATRSRTQPRKRYCLPLSTLP